MAVTECGPLVCLISRAVCRYTLATASYWVSSAVIVALVCVCLVPVAAWAGRGIASRLAAHTPRGAESSMRRSVPVLLVAAAPVLAWLLGKAAEHAYASQVDYTSALLFVRVHSHAFFSGGHEVPAGPPVTAAPFALAYQIAHAFQDGLAGQAAGLPAAFVALLCITRRLRRGHHQIHEGGTENG